MNYGSTIKHFREQAGYSQVDLANAVGISKSRMCNIEKGNGSPSPGTMEKIANALHMPASLIMLHSLEKADAPRGRGKLYDKLMPSIRAMLNDIFMR